jgi:GntR family transcriptional regulator
VSTANSPWNQYGDPEELGVLSRVRPISQAWNKGLTSDDSSCRILLVGTTLPCDVLSSSAAWDLHHKRTPMGIDWLSPVPKYIQVAAYIEGKIDSSEWVPHESIPSERELETRFRVSRTTIRHALDYVTNKGLVYREHGKGTFVARRVQHHSLNQLTSFTKDMRNRGSEPGQRILSYTCVEPDPSVAQALGVEEGAAVVIRIERLRLADGEPISIHRAYLLIDDPSKLKAVDLEASGSLYSVLEAEHGIVPMEADETIEAVVASPEDSSLLNIPRGAPLLLITRVTYSQSHRAFEYAEMLYRADRYKCFAHISRREGARSLGDQD